MLYSSGYNIGLGARSIVRVMVADSELWTFRVAPEIEAKPTVQAAIECRLVLASVVAQKTWGKG